MVAHLTRDGGGPPPPTRNEVLLREAVDRLRLQLDAAREINELAAKAIASARELIGDMPEHVREPCYCPPRAHPTASAFAAFEAAYDKAMGGK